MKSVERKLDLCSRTIRVTISLFWSVVFAATSVRMERQRRTLETMNLAVEAGAHAWRTEYTLEELAGAGRCTCRSRVEERLADKIACPDARPEVGGGARPFRRQLPPDVSARFAEHIPFVAAALFYAALLLSCLYAASARTGGKLIYSLDDTYIHMAAAKTLARHGVWGVSEGPWSGVSSSPAYTLLLAGVYRLFGIHDLAPLVLNVVFSLGVIWVAHLFLKRHAPTLGVPAQTLLLALAVITTSLPGLTLVGMEHTLQCLLVLAILMQGIRLAGGERISWPFSLLCVLAVLVRFESVFLLLALALLLLTRQRVGAAVLLVLLAVLPVALYALVSLQAGGLVLPNSVLLKGATPAELSARSILFTLLPLQAIVRVLALPTDVLPTLIGILVGLAALKGSAHAHGGLGALLLVQGMAVLLHFQFGGMGGATRYEAYLVLTSILVLAVAAATPPGAGLPKSDFRRRGRTHLLLVTASIPLFVFRGASVLRVVCAAPVNIHQQQIQMGEFLREHYQGAVVAANDIGAINYLAEIRCIDLWGLGTTEIARLKLARSFHTQQIDEITRREGASIAILYDVWFEGHRKPPASWVKVATWTIPDNVICGDDTVSFYTVAPGQEAALRRKLALFAPRLPPGVLVRTY